MTVMIKNYRYLKSFKWQKCLNFFCYCLGCVVPVPRRTQSYAWSSPPPYSVSSIPELKPIQYTVKTQDVWRGKLGGEGRPREGEGVAGMFQIFLLENLQEKNKKMNIN